MLLRRSLIFFILVLIILLYTCKSPHQAELENLPIINYFNATPDAIDYLETSTLSWKIVNADMAEIDKIGPIPLIGTHIVKPRESTSYFLTAYNKDGSSQKSCSITVKEKAIIEMAYGPKWVGLNDRDNHSPYCWGEVKNVGNDIARNIQILIIIYDKGGVELDRQLKYTNPAILDVDEHATWFISWYDPNFSLRKKLDTSRTRWEFFYDSGY